MSFITDFKRYIDAAFSGLWVESFESDEVEREIAAAAREKKWDMTCWDAARGFYKPLQSTQSPSSALDPQSALRPAQSAAETQILVLHNFHRFLAMPPVIQELANRIRHGKANRNYTIVISPTTHIPPELEKIITTMSYELPNENELSQIAKELIKEPGATGASINPDAPRAALGLTRYEAENAFTLSLARYGVIEPETIWTQKAQMLKKTNALSLHRSEKGFNSLGGLGAMKEFCIKTIRGSTPKHRARGVMILGVSGTGKTCFAKALGREASRPVLVLDIGAVFSKFVGDSESNVRSHLRIADAMAPAILFIDEGEKMLAGQGSSGDSGVASRIMGTILSWLSEHDTDVYVAMTSNDITKLPPEFTRAGRFDGVFFLDLPDLAQRDAIWKMYSATYNVLNDVRPGDDENFTGAEIESCCRLAALLKITVKEATSLVIPVASVNSEKVEDLRRWALSRCLDANNPGVYTGHSNLHELRRAFNLAPHQITKE